MGRPAKFSSDALLDVAADLVAKGGPTALTAVAVAKVAGAPSGSVYHRFASRDQLAAALWMRTVERFDEEVVAAMAVPGDPIEVAVGVAVRSIEWSADYPVDAFILTMFRRSDLTDDDSAFVPSERAADLGRRQQQMLETLAARLNQPADLVRLAVVGIPMAAIRGYVGARSPIPSWVIATVERAVRAALSPDGQLEEQP